MMALACLAMNANQLFLIRFTFERRRPFVRLARNFLRILVTLLYAEMVRVNAPRTTVGSVKLDFHQSDFNRYALTVVRSHLGATLMSSY